MQEIVCRWCNLQVDLHLASTLTRSQEGLKELSTLLTSFMSHNSKSKAKGINASSFFDLKAELSKQEVEFAKAKAAGRSTSIVGGVKRPDKVVHNFIPLSLYIDILTCLISSETDGMGASE